jgi:aryl-phospho-beta-D-glucosidase BglC (GH1 family)
MPPRGTPPPPLKLVGHRLVNARNNKVVSLRGLNWFGFNVGMGMVDGLWAGGTAAATDFALITYQLRLLGYNAVRLPFTWKDLNMDPRSFDKDCSPVTVEWLRRRLISPHVVDKYANRPLPGNVAPVKNTRAGFCNTYLPQSSGWDRLLYATQTFISQGMYVVLDYQPMVSSAGQPMFDVCVHLSLQDAGPSGCEPHLIFTGLLVALQGNIIK